MNYRIWELQYAGSPKTVWTQVKPTAEQLAIAVSGGDKVGRAGGGLEWTYICGFAGR